MKKMLLSIITGVALMMVPFSASALQMMNADSMKAATGQAGVSIGADEITLIQIKDGSTSYIDNDGDASGLGGGSVTVTDNNSTTLTQVNALFALDPVADLSPTTTHNYTTLAGAVGTAVAAIAPTWIPHALTIDIGVLEVATYFNQLQGGAAGETVAGIKIGLPTVELYQIKNASSKSITIDAVAPAAGTTVINDGAELIEISYSDRTSRTALLGGAVAIWAH